MKRFALIAAAFMAASISADADTSSGYSANLVYNNSTHELVTILTEEQTSSNACDLVVTRFEYMDDLKLMNVELKADFCPMDIVGNRKATISWHVPLPLRQSGEFALRVNGKILGKVVINASGATADLRVRK